MTVSRCHPNWRASDFVERTCIAEKSLRKVKEFHLGDLKYNHLEQGPELCHFTDCGAGSTDEEQRKERSLYYLQPRYHSVNKKH